MTPEQQAEGQVNVNRITAAQNMVTPYVKETAEESVPTVEPPAPKVDLNAGGPK